ncbi:MAG TPA: TIGR00303 family protein [Methanosarcinales archaeon]|nr:TIGR00303 family protein [Methanosarcinales archaeon]
MPHSNWITPAKTSESHLSDPIFLCVLSNTDTCRIPNISAAGATTVLNEYTPAADAEIVAYGSPRSTPEMPMKKGGAPTPAVMTRAALQLTGMPYFFINAGLRIVPDVPAIDLGAEPGHDIRHGDAVSRPGAIYSSACQIGSQFGKLSDFIIIGESIPGGTTTALGVLTALGYDYGVSSSFSENPLEIKRDVVRKGISASGITVSEACENPMRAIAALGDPMMPAVAGVVAGVVDVVTSAGTGSRDCDIILAGGTQMVAVFAIMKHLGLDMKRISIATTKYVYQDRSIDFEAVIRDLGCRIHVVDPGFADSRLSGLRKYEAGEVKEGVGAGGAMYTAGMLGIDQKTMLGTVEMVYEELMREDGTRLDQKPSAILRV